MSHQEQTDPEDATCSKKCEPASDRASGHPHTYAQRERPTHEEHATRKMKMNEACKQHCQPRKLKIQRPNADQSRSAFHDDSNASTPVHCPHPMVCSKMNSTSRHRISGQHPSNAYPSQQRISKTQETHASIPASQSVQCTDASRHERGGDTRRPEAS